MAKIGKYEVPDEIAAAGWVHSGSCSCNGLVQLKFRNDSYKHYELRFAPSLAITGRSLRLKHYGAVVTKWFTPSELETEMNKIKEKQNG